ncbi:MAG: leucine-rich repeat protein [Prevotella sp.]|nr:leucine-rich repeat protein [Prevotella sp.]
MKKIKKLLPVLLMSIMSVSAFAEDAIIDGIKYRLNDETLEAEVAKKYGEKYSGDIIIPETVDYDGKTYSVTNIGDYAFEYCSGLTSVTIGNSVSSIGNDAFAYCTGLTSVISLIEEPFEINENTFYSLVKGHEEFTTATLYVPAGTKAKYESTPAWNKFKNIVEGIENAVKSVETDAKAEETERYNVSGQRISTPQKGLNIVKMSDGTTRKIMCK